MFLTLLCHLFVHLETNTVHTEIMIISYFLPSPGCGEVLEIKTEVDFQERCMVFALQYPLGVWLTVAIAWKHNEYIDWQVGCYSDQFSRYASVLCLFYTGCSSLSLSLSLHPPLSP